MTEESTALVSYAADENSVSLGVNFIDFLAGVRHNRD